MARSELQQRVSDYLREHNVATLATTGSDGPWASAVFYASDGYTLYFLSSPTTRHCSNLQQNPRVAATIQAECRDWKEIKGVQLEGKVSELAGAEEARARGLYAEKFPMVGQLSKLPPAIAEALARVRWYRLDPARLHFIDNSVAFGQRDEIDLNAG